MNKGLAQTEIIHSTNVKEVRKIGKYLPTVRCKWTNYEGHTESHEQRRIVGNSATSNN